MKQLERIALSGIAALIVALMAVLGAAVLEFIAHMGIPQWLVTVIIVAVGYGGLAALGGLFGLAVLSRMD